MFADRSVGRWWEKRTVDGLVRYSVVQRNGDSDTWRFWTVGNGRYTNRLALFTTPRWGPRL